MPTELEGSEEFDDALEEARGFIARARAVFELLYGHLVDPDEVPLNPAAAGDAYVEGAHFFRETQRHLDSLRALHREALAKHEGRA